MQNLLYNVQDEHNGRVPNYGANDGSNIISLSDCDYLDYRPVISTLSYLLKGVSPYQPGPHDQDIYWLTGLPTMERETLKRSNYAAEEGGYYVLRDDNGMAFVRCHTYKSRPGDADSLHVDLWRDGIRTTGAWRITTVFRPEQPCLTLWPKEGSSPLLSERWPSTATRS